MSFARPQSLAGIHPDTVRIVAMSAAIALNAAALIAVMRPMVAQMADTPPSPKTFVLQFVEPPPPVKPPPPIELERLPTKAPVVTHVQKQVEALPVVAPPVASDEGSVPMTPPAAAVDTVSPPAVQAGPVEATLAYVSAPAPRYPAQAIRGHMQGTVTLRVLVDETGKPLEVIVESSSGHELLDRAARDQVLARWRFQPAQANGHQVRAWARIPVTFDLRSI
ncbi:MAG TPA: TonB family protein [Luteibacter sp.]|uniref:energy transducer TonB n=1 Tax=Luteibacter sp. TaxID=1886636 RepID=UPI002C00998D|nr:TonB family protein [Luteibacter sp.]HVI53878.1 TonB family protein [Luteibacter sp.]